MEHRLAAVLISDIVDYTKLMEVDTDGTVGDVTFVYRGD